MPSGYYPSRTVDLGRDKFCSHLLGFRQREAEHEVFLPSRYRAVSASESYICGAFFIYGTKSRGTELYG